MSNKLNAADYLLFLLDTDERTPINGAIRLMKMMFLFNQEIMPVISKKGANVGELPQFFAYDFGPFSKDIYEQIEFFENLDSGLTSQYFYKPAADHEQRSVLYAGPVWDYDWSCGNGDFSVCIIKNLHAAQTYNTKFYYSYWYGALNEKIAFQQELKNIYQEIYPKTNAYLQNTLTELCSEIAASWELDKLRWAHSEKNINTVQFDTLAEHSAYIYTFLTKRAEFLYDVWCHNTTFYTLMCDTQLNSRYWYYSLKPNESITLPVPTLDGYTFLGWCTADGQAFNGKISEDTTIYAQWQKQE